jgi:hypothetical protein
VYICRLLSKGADTVYTVYYIQYIYTGIYIYRHTTVVYIYRLLSQGADTDAEANDGIYIQAYIQVYIYIFIYIYIYISRYVYRTLAAALGRAQRPPAGM